MNHVETARLCDVIAGIAPAQAFDEHTPALWQGVLADVRLADALEAVKRLAGERPFIAPADIVGKVAVIRGERLVGSDLVLPNVDPDDVVAFARELAALRVAIADGGFNVESYVDGGWTVTGARPFRALGQPMEGRRLQLEGVFTRA